MCSGSPSTFTPSRVRITRCSGSVSRAPSAPVCPLTARRETVYVFGRGGEYRIDHPAVAPYVHVNGFAGHGLNDTLIFVKVVEHGSVTAAARSLGLPKTTVSRKLRDLDVTTAPELPLAEPIDTVPRVLKQVGLMGVPDEATVEPEIT